MTTGRSPSAVAGVRAGRQRLNVVAAIVATIPGLLLGLALLRDLPHPTLVPWMDALVFGLAVVGAAFLLAWAAEVAQLDVSAGAGHPRPAPYPYDQLGDGARDVQEPAGRYSLDGSPPRPPASHRPDPVPPGPSQQRRQGGAMQPRTRR